MSKKKRMKQQKIGRNAPCPCGSGIKYKRCCLNKVGTKPKPIDSLPPDVAHRLKKGLRKQQRKIEIHKINEKIRQEKFGDVRPIIHVDFQDHKFVAVGNQLHYSKNWKTFPDFLRSYIAAVLDKEWGDSELKKSYEERHQIIKWYPDIFRKMINKKEEHNGTYSGEPDGVTAAYLRLSYDLYILRHHTALQKEVVRRLKIKDQFQGARHELFVAATFIRAGFDINYEDETDRTTKHPEFKATHKETGEILSVEAKSRHRAGVLDFNADGSKDDQYKAGVKRLMNKAFKKEAKYPYVVFIDLNLPPSEEPIQNKPWFGEIKNSIGEEGVCTPENPDPYNLLIFSNHPEHYAKLGERCPNNEHLYVISQCPRVPIEDQKILMKITKATDQYGNVPNIFPPDWDSGIIQQKI